MPFVACASAYAKATLLNVMCRLEVRPSMRKFDSGACILEVCEIAQYSPGYLNRQLITLLLKKSLGVPDSSFRQLQVPFFAPSRQL